MLFSEALLRIWLCLRAVFVYLFIKVKLAIISGVKPLNQGGQLFAREQGVATSIISHLVQGRYKNLADIPQSLAPGPY